MVTAMLPMLTRSIRIFFTRAQLPHKMRIVIPQHFVKIFDIFILESLLLDCKTISDMIAQCFMAAAPPTLDDSLLQNGVVRVMLAV